MQSTLRSLHRSSRLDVSHPTYDLAVVVFKRSFYFRKSVLEIQLQTPRGSEETSKRLRVEWSPKSSHTHKCATSPRADSEDIAQLANGVIQQCIQHHTLCKREFVDKESRGYLPLRLVDAQDCENGVVDIISTAKFPKRAVEYLASSHYWGGKAGVKLMKADLLIRGSA